MVREGFLIRLLAVLIDAVIFGVVWFVLALIFGVSMMGANGVAGQPNAAGNQTGQAVAVAGSFAFLLVLSIFGICYNLTEIFLAATPGKMALGLRIANEDGTPASTATLATRWAVKNSGSILRFLAVVSGLAFLGTIGGLAGLVIVIGCFFVLGAARQAFHDMAAKTAVFKKDAVPARGFEVLPPATPPV
jgi:uncharacterized RDD family membrane protein YckC